jgi:hypothetical protein
MFDYACNCTSKLTQKSPAASLLSERMQQDLRDWLDLQAHPNNKWNKEHHLPKEPLQKTLYKKKPLLKKHYKKNITKRTLQKEHYQKNLTNKTETRGLRM